MNHIELAVKPILKETGFFNGKEVSVKEVFEKYLQKFPSGIGPLGVFKKLVEYELNLGVKEIRNGNKTDFMFVCNKADEGYDNLLNYDPRIKEI